MSDRPDLIEELEAEGGENFRRLVDEAFVRRHKIRQQLVNLGLLAKEAKEL